MLTLNGFYDLHIHSAPAPFVRIGDSADIARWCSEAGMAGTVTKSHFESTVSKAYHARLAVRDAYPAFQVFSGIALNRGVGGVNPGAVELALQHAFMLVTGFAQSRREIDQAGHDDAARGIDRPARLEVAGHAADADDAPRGDGDVCALVAARHRIDHAAVTDDDVHGSFPEMMLITAMRTAMPNVTCGRITLWRPSATVESISTPRFMGPGCMTIASAFARRSFSAVSP